MLPNSVAYSSSTSCSNGDSVSAAGAEVVELVGAGVSGGAVEAMVRFGRRCGGCGFGVAVSWDVGRYFVDGVYLVDWTARN